MIVGFAYPQATQAEIACPDLKAAGRRVVVEFRQGACADPGIGVTLGADESSSEWRQTPEPAAWTAQLEERFRSLVTHLAQKTLPANEEAELRIMRTWRRNLHHPLSGREVAAAYHRDQVLKSIHDALQKYITFHETTR